MTKYSSSSNYLNYDAVIGSIMVLAFGILSAIALDVLWMKILSIFISVGVIALIVLYRRNNTFHISFLQEEILVEYLFINQNMNISYDDLLQIDYCKGYRSPITNRIRFKKDNKIESLKFLTVANSDEYIDFVKWLKSKNDKLKLKVFPDSNIMNHKIQEEFGFKYR